MHICLYTGVGIKLFGRFSPPLQQTHTVTRFMGVRIGVLKSFENLSPFLAKTPPKQLGFNFVL